MSDTGVFGAIRTGFIPIILALITIVDCLAGYAVKVIQQQLFAATIGNLVHEHQRFAIEPNQTKECHEGD